MGYNKSYFDDEFERLQNDLFYTDKELLKVILRDYVDRLNDDNIKHQYAIYTKIALIITISVLIIAWSLI